MTYEYVCEACGHLWEAEQSIKDSPLKKCVSCGKSKAKRLVSGGTGFLLKGGGWYADGYGSPGAAASKAKSDEKTGAKAKAEGGDTKAADSKSADGKSGDSKSADSKSGGEGKAGDSKVAADKGSSSAGTTAPAPGSAKAS